MESNWKIGDVAICVKVGRLDGYVHDDKSDYPNLRLNAEYIVNAVKACECGAVSLDVGLNSNGNKGTTCTCGAVSRPGTGIHWCAASRFAKKRTIAEIKEALNEAVQNEDFLSATELQTPIRYVKQKLNLKHMKKAIFTALVLLSMSFSYAQDKYDLDKQAKQATYKETGETAKYKGVSHPVYVSSKGKLFIFVTSAKTGKQYRKYITTT